MNLYDIEAKTIAGKTEKLETYRGRVLLIVNVASRCMFTKQYAGLEAIYQHWKDNGLTILGFPCNQFGSQEPGDEASIQQFCSLTYNVTFPMFAKVDVNGPGTHPLYEMLKEAKRGLFGTRSIKWNFTKFLVDRDGNVVKRLGPAANSGKVEKELAKLLN